MSRSAGSAVAAAIAGVLLLAGCASGEEPADSTAPAPVQSESSAPQPTPTTGQSSAPAPVAGPGSYIDYGAYQSDPASFAAAGDVVLFFNASWCPTCRTTVANLEGAAVPSGLTVVSVDYDSSTDLRREYGVTVQHTFVQVDASGGQLAKWTGSLTADQIAAKTV